MTKCLVANWKNKELAEENNKLNKGYFAAEEYKKYTSFQKSKEALQYIVTHHETPIELLDVGCGSGWQAIYFQREGIFLDYWGLDISSYMCTFGKENYPAGTFITGDIGEIYLKKQFDIVMESAVIELVDDWKKCVEGMIKHSKQWLVFHRMFFTNTHTFMEQGTTYKGLPDLRRHIGLQDLKEELQKYNFLLDHQDVWNINPSYKMGTFIARRI